MKMKYNDDVDAMIVREKLSNITRRKKYVSADERFKRYEEQIKAMCPVCFKLMDVKYKYEIKSEDSDYQSFFMLHSYMEKCKFCGADYVDLINLDYNIANVISIFNHKGFKTKFCCEGHNDNSNAYIYFKDNSIEQYLSMLPDTWYLDINDKRYGFYDEELKIINSSKTTIRSEFFNHDEAMRDILVFAEALPNESKSNI